MRASNITIALHLGIKFIKLGMGHKVFITGLSTVNCKLAILFEILHKLPLVAN